MAKRNPLIEMFQQKIADGGVAINVTGAWDAQTRVAMQAFQVANGLVATNWPNADVLAVSGLAPAAWSAIAAGSGAAKEWIAAVASTANKLIAAQTAAITAEAFRQTVGRDGTTSSLPSSSSGFPAPMVPADRSGTRIASTRPQAGVAPAGTTALPEAALVSMIPPATKPGLPWWGWTLIAVGAAVVVGGGVFVYMRSRPAVGGV